MKNLLSIVLLLFISTSLIAQSYETINGVSVELPYFNTISDAMGNVVKLSNIKELIDKEVFYRLETRNNKTKASKVKELWNTNGEYRVEKLETIKKNVYVRIHNIKNNLTFGLLQSDSYNICDYLINENAKKTFEEYLKKNCSYKKCLNSVYTERMDNLNITFIVHWKKYSFSYISLESINGKPHLQVKEKDNNVSYRDYFNNKDQYISESEFKEMYNKAFKQAKENHANKIMENAKKNKEKYGSEVASAIMSIELGIIPKPWFLHVDPQMTLVDLTYERYGGEITANILRGKVLIGYDSQICEVAWGEPDKINRTSYSNGTYEQWVYREKDAYLYFENGILTAIQD